MVEIEAKKAVEYEGCSGCRAYKKEVERLKDERKGLLDQIQRVIQDREQYAEYWKLKCVDLELQLQDVSKGR